MTVAQWARDDRCRVDGRELAWRLAAGWQPERALSERPHTIILTAFGERKSLEAWFRDPRCVVSRKALRKRLGARWGHQEALATPVINRNSLARPPVSESNPT